MTVLRSFSNFVIDYDDEDIVLTLYASINTQIHHYVIADYVVEVWGVYIINTESCQPTIHIFITGPELIKNQHVSYV